MLKRSLYILIALSMLFPGLAAQEKAPLAPSDIPAAFSYEIKAILDTVGWVIEGEEKVTCHNRTSRAVDELVFILSGNRYANSLALEEGGLKMPPENDPEAALRTLGYTDILEISMGDGTPLAEPPVIRGTRMTVRLPEALEPGGQAALAIKFVTKLPDRTMGQGGVLGRHIVAVEWYARLAALTEDGWKFPAKENPASFFPGFGDFDVTLSLDSSFTVDASGTLKESHDENERRTVRFEARGVQDFAWTADPSYIEEKNIYRDVEIVILGQPFMEEKLPALMGTVKSGLDHFSKTLVPYPYDRLVVATGPYGIHGSMAGPMFISLTQEFPTHTKFLLEKSFLPEDDLIHEMARQYFCGLLAGADDTGSWLGEGLATFFRFKTGDVGVQSGASAPALVCLEKEVLFHLFNEGFGLYHRAGEEPGSGVCCHAAKPYLRYINLTNLFGLTSSPFHPEGKSTLLGYSMESLDQAGWGDRGLAALKNEFVRSSDPGWRRYSKSDHARLCQKTVLTLITLQNHIGSEKMDEILKTYVDRFMFESPGLDDFLLVVLEKAGLEHAEMFGALLGDRGTVDYAIESARCEAITEARGFITQNNVSDRVVENITAPEGETKAPCKPIGWGTIIRFGCESTSGGGEAAPEEEPPIYQWEVIVRNRGDMALPVSIQLQFEGGKTAIKRWDGKGGMLHLSGEGIERLLSAAVDPEELYAVDINRINNSRLVTFNDRGVLFLAGWTQFWIQNYLNGWAFLN